MDYDDRVKLGLSALRAGNNYKFANQLSSSGFTVIGSTAGPKYGAVTMVEWDPDEREWRDYTFIAQRDPLRGWSTSGDMSGSYMPMLSSMRTYWPWGADLVREDFRHIAWIEDGASPIKLCCVGLWCRREISAGEIETSLGRVVSYPSLWRLMLFVVPVGETVNISIKDLSGRQVEALSIYEPCE